MRLVGKRVAREANARSHYAAAASAFQLYTLTHPEMRERLTRHNAASYKVMAAQLVKIIPVSQLPMSAKRFVRALDGLIAGLLFTYFQTPQLVTEDIFIAAFEAPA